MFGLIQVLPIKVNSLFYDSKLEFVALADDAVLTVHLAISGDCMVRQQSVKLLG